MNVQKNREGPPAGKPINIEVSGEEFEELIAIAEKLKGEITEQSIPGVEGLKLDLETGKPELLVNVDRARARMFGLSTAQIGGTLRTALFGKEISKFKEGEDPIAYRKDFFEPYRCIFPSMNSLSNAYFFFTHQLPPKFLQNKEILKKIADVFGDVFPFSSKPLMYWLYRRRKLYPKDIQSHTDIMDGFFDSLAPSFLLLKLSPYIISSRVYSHR